MDKVVTLHAVSSSDHKDVLAGHVVFGNDLLVLEGSPFRTEPVWTLNGVEADLLDDGRLAIHPQISSLDHSPDGQFGRIFENEHGLSARFFFESEQFELLQQAALSAASLEITIGFAADKGTITALWLGIGRKKA